MVWKFSQLSGNVSQYLLGSYSARMFHNCLRVSRPTFSYLCHLLGPILSKKDTIVKISLHCICHGMRCWRPHLIYGVSSI